MEIIFFFYTKKQKKYSGTLSHQLSVALFLYYILTIDGKHERNKNYIKKGSSINEIITDFKAGNVGRA